MVVLFGYKTFAHKSRLPSPNHKNLCFFIPAIILSTKPQNKTDTLALCWGMLYKNFNWSSGISLFSWWSVFLFDWTKQLQKKEKDNFAISTDVTMDQVIGSIISPPEGSILDIVIRGIFTPNKYSGRRVVTVISYSFLKNNNDNIETGLTERCNVMRSITKTLFLCRKWNLLLSTWCSW